MTLLVDSSRNNLQDTFIINSDGAKNAILPLMVSKLLVPGKTIFTNVPTESEDVKTMASSLTRRFRIVYIYLLTQVVLRSNHKKIVRVIGLFFKHKDNSKE